jgi:type II secretory pathway component PulC
VRRLLLAILLSGCAAQTAESPPPRETEEAPPVATAPQPTGTATPSATPAVTPAAATSLSRRALLVVLDQSPGAFLAHVDLLPRFTGGRFAGWRVVRFFPGDDRFARVDVQAGDVVRSVNGLPIEKPEQLMALWQLLRTAPELMVELERAGAARTLRWPITE